MADAARVNPDCHVLHFETVQDFIEKMPRLIRKGDTVLVKASHFMKFDDIVKALTIEFAGAFSFLQEKSG